MKHIFVSLLLITTLSVFSQKDFSINRVIDEFDGDTTVKTTWIKLNQSNWGSGPLTHIRFIIKKGWMFLELRIADGRVVSVKEDSEFLIKLNNGEIVKLYNYEYAISGTGDGAVSFYASSAMGIKLFFPISLDNLAKFASDAYEKCRLRTTDGYIIIEPEKKKYATTAESYIQVFYRFINDTYADKLMHIP